LQGMERSGLSTSDFTSGELSSAACRTSLVGDATHCQVELD